MAEISPFAGLRFDLARVGDAGRVLCPPYDVIGEGERLDLEARHAQNVVRLELPRGEGADRYAGAARLLAAWRAEGILRPDAGPALYAYEQKFSFPMGTLEGSPTPPAKDSAGASPAPSTRFATKTYVRRGFMAAVRLEPIEARVVLPHERTLSGPKEDRRLLMAATRTQVSPVFGLYRDADGASEVELEAATADVPGLDATTPDGVRHRLWAVTDPARIATLAAILREKQILIADGHHRYETLLGLRDELRPAGAAPGRAAADYGLMFLARAEDPGLLVLPTHRLLKGLPGFRAEAFRAAAAAAFDIAPGPEATAETIEERLRQAAAAGHPLRNPQTGSEPPAMGSVQASWTSPDAKPRVTFALRVPGEADTTWLTLKPTVDLSALGPPALQGLDVTVLHGLLLGPLLGIDAAAMERQAYLAYTHDTVEALARASSGEVEAAFLMNATKVGQVLDACEAGFVLPQKSTYFYPKLATGLCMYSLDGEAPARPR